MGQKLNGEQPTLFDAAARYPRRAGFKEPTTSREAAQKIERSGRAKRLKAACLALFVEGWTGTADEMAARLGESVLSVRPRIAQLHALEDIEPTGERRRNASGSNAHVWQLNPSRQRRAG